MTRPYSVRLELQVSVLADNMEQAEEAAMDAVEVWLEDATDQEGFPTLEDGFVVAVRAEESN